MGISPATYALAIMGAIFVPATIGGWVLTRWPGLVEPETVAARLFFLLFAALSGTWTVHALYALWTTPTP